MSQSNAAIFDRLCIIEGFLRGGTVSDPEKSYHLEFLCGTEGEARSIIEAAKKFEIACGSIKRKNSYVVYLKDSGAISDMLTVMGANNARLKYEDIKVLREMRETVQRRVNCETANISKTVSASLKQLDDIRTIQEKKGLDFLPEGLREAARLRLDYPDATLGELTGHVPGLTRSGMNHRFRKIAEIAGDLRSGSGI